MMNSKYFYTVYSTWTDHPSTGYQNTKKKAELVKMVVHRCQLVIFGF